jgi:hypothetical protein
MKNLYIGIFLTYIFIFKPSSIYSFFTVSIHLVAQAFISMIKITLLHASVHNCLYLFKLALGE